MDLAPRTGIKEAGPLTDASGNAPGAVLLQRWGEEELPISFASCKLSQAKTRCFSPEEPTKEACHVHEKEHQAIQEAI
ncbi:hypothetical protein Y1Q_0017760 [Alligator mississippiensis]|uniref:Reverse transcriptase RNase H-like domain-containing protein n=1 Tax=Alligator mississippiensis TaxID=8496 RepID=A0A151MJE3_ALLMI|nr:hypothetical protein Y1Q_0017760 [Alligator mississippiensis]